MTDRCPYLEYRASDDGHSFDGERAYCTVVDAFVQPMRADVCNARHGLSPRAHCEFYREHENVPATETRSAVADGGEAGAGGPGSSSGAGGSGSSSGAGSTGSSSGAGSSGSSSGAATDEGPGEVPDDPDGDG